MGAGPEWIILGGGLRKPQGVAWEKVCIDQLEFVEVTGT